MTFAWSSAFPVRQAGVVTPMAEASNIYPAMEEMVMRAERFCLLSFRIFDPHTRLRSPNRPLELHNWGELIAHKTQQGVDVFLLHSDFEPIGAWELHKAAWSNIAHLVDAVKTRGNPEKLHAFCALHQAELGGGLARLFWPILRMHLARHARQMDRMGGALSADYRHSPGLWPHLLPGSKRLKIKALPFIRAWPATYHQKMMVVDGREAFIGGLDINERRYDDPEHNQTPGQTWHDVSAHVEGPAAGDMHCHFADCWEHELENIARRPLQFDDRPDLPVNLEAIAPCPVAEGSHATAREGEPSVRLLRTVSARNAHPFSFGPAPMLREIEEAHLQAIARAEDLIYIETQFLRSRPIAEALANRAKENPRLGLIVVLPAAPEDVAFLAKRGPGEKHGEWLQARALRKVGKAFGVRAGFFCLAKQQAWVEHAERDAVYGAGIIYCHAKVMLIDDRDAFITSANLNGRSLAWDTEAGVLWQNDADRIRAFRQELWQMHLHVDTSELVRQGGIAASAAWQRQAARNANLKPHEREGFILPFPMRKTRRFAARRFLVPDNMV